MNENSQKTKKEIYLEYLVENGYRPEVSDDGVITFKKQGFYYIIVPDEDDRLYFHMAIPDFVPDFQGEADLNVAIHIATRLTSKYKGAKLLVFDDGCVHACMELFLGDPAGMAPIFERITDLLAEAAFEYRQLLRHALDDQEEAGAEGLVSEGQGLVEN